MKWQWQWQWQGYLHAASVDIAYLRGLRRHRRDGARRPQTPLRTRAEVRTTSTVSQSLVLSTTHSLTHSLTHTHTYRVRMAARAVKRSPERISKENAQRTSLGGGGNGNGTFIHTPSHIHFALSLSLCPISIFTHSFLHPFTPSFTIND